MVMPTNVSRCLRNCAVAFFDSAFALKVVVLRHLLLPSTIALQSFECHERALEAMRPNLFTQGEEEYGDTADEELEGDVGVPDPDSKGASIQLFKFVGDWKIDGKLVGQGCLLHHVLREGIGLHGHGDFYG